MCLQGAREQCLVVAEAIQACGLEVVAAEVNLKVRHAFGVVFAGPGRAHLVAFDPGRWANAIGQRANVSRQSR